MALDKPSDQEDEYFARVNADKRKKLRSERDTQRKAERKQKEKDAHWMKCPKCGGDLEEIVHQDIAIDKCTGCGGVWLDNGELELLISAAEQSGGILRRIFK